jgi:hypothetical protein
MTNLYRASQWWGCFSHRLPACLPEATATLTLRTPPQHLIPRTRASLNSSLQGGFLGPPPTRLGNKCVAQRVLVAIHPLPETVQRFMPRLPEITEEFTRAREGRRRAAFSLLRDCRRHRSSTLIALSPSADRRAGESYHARPRPGTLRCSTVVG